MTLGNPECSPSWSGGCSLLYATPHPYRDIPRLRSSYGRLPYWRYLTEEHLNEEASAVVLTHPNDVEAVRSLLLPVIGFRGPYTVLPVYERFGTHTDHAEVMVIARRPEPAPPADRFPLVKGELLHPADVARKLQPTARRALRLFAQDDRLLFDGPPHPTDLLGPRPSPRHVEWPSAESPGCWRAWDE